MTAGNMRIRAITFDVGGTLIQPWPSVGHVYAEVAAKHGVAGLNVEELNTAFKTAWRDADGFDYTRAGWERLVARTFAEWLPNGVPFFGALYERFSEPDVWKVFDDVFATLDQLASAGVLMGVVSNWDDRLRPLLKELALDRFFEAMAISCEVGFPKPSPVIFQCSAEQLGLVPGLILHIGDSIDLDFAGARAAGFRSVHLDRSSAPKSSNEVGSLIELIALAGDN